MASALPCQDASGFSHRALSHWRRLYLELRLQLSLVEWSASKITCTFYLLCLNFHNGNMDDAFYVLTSIIESDKFVLDNISLPH